MAPSGALLFSKWGPLLCKRGPAFGHLSVSGYYFLLVDIFGLSVALIQSLYWGPHHLLGPHQHAGPSVWHGSQSVFGATDVYVDGQVVGPQYEYPGS